MKPNKFLGQNFLTSKKIIEDIIRAADLQPDDVVLEVGPGKGILTEALLEKVPRGKVIAVEKDKRLAEFLYTKLSGRANLYIINEDILKFNPSGYSLVDNNYKIVANIPYYITSRFLRKFLESDCQPAKMVLMVQKEVAERIVGEGRTFANKRRSDLRRKESILSISVKAYGQPKIIKKVPAKYFSPRPKVDSAILLIDNISKKFFYAQGGPASGGKNIDEKKFFSLVKQGFSQKRKLLKNNLKLLDTEPGALIKCGIEEKARAEDLSLEDWKCLVKYDIIKQ